MQKYTRGRVLVKVRTEFKDEVANLSLSKGTKVKDVALSSVTRMLPPGAENRIDKSGRRLQNPVVDISKYYSLTFDVTQDVEEYINKLYATGYFEIVEPEYKYKTDFKPNDPSVTQQYYLSLINAFDAWDITKGDTAMVIAIVDTGGNLTHSDIAPNLYRNWAEYPPNGVDDDGNGFIDDYQGWDFVGSDTSNLSKPGFVGDNDPSIHIGGDVSHGTWVAGCASAATNNGIGIAGVGFKSRLLFTKQSADDQKTTDGSEYAAYSGLLYAGYQKDVKIINCSFGGTDQSQIIQDLINHIVLDQNRVIVASAGNSNTSQPNYPGAYDNVLSVAATDQNDVKASFTSYGTTIDISAPGVGIYTTGYNNVYNTVDGTSFSSPITSGAVALVWAANPSFTAVQVREQLRVSADAKALNTANPDFLHQLGAGRLDIKRALTLSLPSIRAATLKMVNQNGLAPIPGDKALLSFDFTNYLKSTSTAIQISISTTSNGVTISKSTITPGIIAGGATFNNNLTPFEMTIAANAAQNTPVILLISYSDGSYSDYQYINFFVNPSFIDVNSNQVTTTMTSIGRIGFLDTQDDTRTEGQGFIFNQTPLLYEMGLIMGTSSTNLYNNVRGINGNFDEDFSSTVQIKQIFPGLRSYSEIFGEFSNSTTPAQQAVVADYRSMVWQNSPYDKFVILEYQVKNPTASDLNNFYFGIFSDWDINNSGANDAAGWDNNNNLGYVYPAQTASIKPYAGIQVLTGSPAYYAIENDNTIKGNPFGLYDGFTNSEKYTTISAAIGSGRESLQAGVGAQTPNGTDVSHVVSSGPLTIAAGKTVTIAFALHAAANLSDLQLSARYADSLYNYTLKAVKPEGDSVGICYNTSTTLNASGPLVIKWYNTFTGGQSFFTGAQYTTGNLLNDTVFYVSNADQPYESVRTSMKATVKANPKIFTSRSPVLGQGDTVELFVAQDDSTLWSDGEKTNSIQVTTTGKYSIKVKNNTLNCSSFSDTVTVSVNPNPTADFLVSSGELKIYTPITFTDQSVDAEGWYWDFGDGQSSTNQNPQHSYGAIKNYTVKLTVTANDGCVNAKSMSISVVTEIDEPSMNEIKVYPNPVTSDYLNIVLPSGGYPATLTLTDILGRQISQTPLGATDGELKFFVGSLNEGVYIVRVGANQGQQATMKIIIKR